MERLRRSLEIIQAKQRENPIAQLPDGRIVTRGANGEWEQIGTVREADDWGERKELLLYERAAMKEVLGKECGSARTAASKVHGHERADNARNHGYFREAARILVVGDGDLSWSTSLICSGCVSDAANLTCTVLEESEKNFLEQYKEEEARENLDILIGRGAKVLFGVDATNTQLDLYGRCCGQLFDVVVWNFPYVSNTARPAEQGACNSGDRDGLTQAIVGNFLSGAQRNLMAHGEIWIGLVGQQLARWGVMEAADRHGLVRKRSVDFRSEDFPGYRTRFGDQRDRDGKPAGYLKGRSPGGAPRYHVFVARLVEQPTAAGESPSKMKTKKKRKKQKKSRQEDGEAVSGGQSSTNAPATCIVGRMGEVRWAPLDVTVKMTCPEGEEMRGDLFGATWWDMEELGMFVEHIYPGEPLHTAITHEIPRPYEILPSGRILFGPTDHEGKDLLFFKVLDVNGCGDDIDALNDAIGRYKVVIMAEDRISKYPSVLRRNAGLQLEVKLRILPMKLGSLPDEALQLLSESWSKDLDLSNPLACAQLHPRWHIDKHPVPDCFRTTYA